jgi:hypothetical protein
MMWCLYLCNEDHEDIPFECSKDGKVYYWTIGAAPPEYATVLQHDVESLVVAKQWLVQEGYTLNEES